MFRSRPKPELQFIVSNVVLRRSSVPSVELTLRVRNVGALPASNVQIWVRRDHGMKMNPALKGAPSSDSTDVPFTVIDGRRSGGLLIPRLRPGDETEYRVAYYAGDTHFWDIMPTVTDGGTASLRVRSDEGGIRGVDGSRDCWNEGLR